MSAIPPSSLASIIQSAGAVDRAAGAKRTERATEAERSANFSENLLDVIENNDRDSEVYSDGEGAGGQGRPFEEEGENPPEDQPSADGAAPGGETHLDVCG
jgi:hypothetical protein